jgi:hypothetical protein
LGGFEEIMPHEKIVKHECYLSGHSIAKIERTNVDTRIVVSSATLTKRAGVEGFLLIRKESNTPQHISETFEACRGNDNIVTVGGASAVCGQFRNAL